MLAPALRDDYGLSLGQTGVVLGAVGVGSTFTLLAWGLAADRVGERAVIAAGLSTAAAALAAGASTSTYAPLLAALIATGALAASVNAASGRAVMHWFGPEERGLALGVRQTAMPIGGAVVSVGLPAIGSVGGALLALAAGLLAAGALGGALLREGARPDAEAAPPSRETLRDRRIWRLSWASALLLAPQVCLVGFAVLFLHERRGLSPRDAALVLAVVQLLGIAARIGAGRWSDVAGSRIVPLRRVAVALALAVGLTAVLTGAPRALLVPALVVAGVLAMSWNGLSFTATAELAGRTRSGAALGLQQTVLAIAGAALPPAFAVLVAATSWQAAIAVLALGPLAAYGVLGRLT